MRNRKFALVVFFLIAALTLGIGYAALTDTLTIIGNAHIDMDAAAGQFEEKVYFAAAEATSSTKEARTGRAPAAIPQVAIPTTIRT